MKHDTNQKSIVIFDSSKELAVKICTKLSKLKNISVKNCQFLKNITFTNEYDLMIFYIFDDNSDLLIKKINCNLSAKNKANTLIILKKFNEEIVTRFFLNNIYLVYEEAQLLKNDILKNLILCILNSPQNSNKNVYFDDSDNSLLINSSKIFLTERESQICNLFLQRLNSYLKIEEIKNALMQNNIYELNENAICTTIHRLRNKIYKQSGYKPIRCRYKKGYIFRDYSCGN